MTGKLLLPVVLLVLSMVGAVATLLAESRRGRLASRIAVVTGGEGSSEAERDTGQGIRLVTRAQGSPTTRLLSLLKVPVDLPQAHFVAPWLVATIGVAVVIGGYLAGRLYFSWPIALLEAIFSAAFLVRGIFGWEKRRYAAALTKQLPDVIELMSAVVTAGLPAVQALRTIRDEIPAPTRDQFEIVVQEIALGVTADAALLSLYRRTGVVEYSILGVTLGVQARSGGRLVETIQTLADTIRQRLAIAARGNALAAEAKLSAYVIAAMPVVGGMVLSVIQPGYMDPLFFDPRGNKMLFVGIGLLVTGSYIMMRMIRGALSD